MPLAAHRVASGADFDKEIVDQLQQSTRLECQDFPLDEVMAFLADYHDITIVLDQQALTMVNIAPKLPVTINTNQTPNLRLEELLVKLLHPLQLSFMIEGGALKITTVTKAKTWQEEYAKAFKKDQ